ncbi:MAG TPA: SDR family oxidoreductase [Gemmatimonadaceae bacterium]|jgi:nucleoside-diphosphate-sugar epimerase|nr:SDR family oxidoreductase [Gemmatimonadaceae bacterium]
MRVAVTGHNGYIGSVMVPFLEKAGHEVVGIDTYLYEGCTFGPEVPDVPAVRLDLRDVEPEALRGFDAVIHLAALCNDPLGNMNPGTTYDINHHASVRLAKAAKAAGVRRFLFASSCSLYGLSGDEMLTEEAAFNPITPYGESKIRSERDIRPLADESFSPVYLRNATAFGVSPRLRCDIVVNNLVGFAFTQGDVLIQSDGSPWRPLVHIEDISRAFLAALEAPREVIHNQAFNVGRNDDNLRVREIADMVKAVVPGCTIRYAEGGGPDPRCYRVDCSKIARTLPAFRPQWTVASGVVELYNAYRDAELTADEFQSNRYLRLKQIRKLQDEGRLDDDLRWLEPAMMAALR